MFRRGILLLTIRQILRRRRVLIRHRRSLRPHHRITVTPHHTTTQNPIIGHHTQPILRRVHIPLQLQLLLILFPLQILKFPLQLILIPLKFRNRVLLDEFLRIEWRVLVEIVVVLEIVFYLSALGLLCEGEGTFLRGVGWLLLGFLVGLVLVLMGLLQLGLVLLQLLFV